MMQMEREIRKLLDPEWGHYSIERTNGGHLRVTLRAGEHQRFVIAPSTPSDYRSIPNTKAELRRAMRELRFAAGIRTPQPDAVEKPRRRHRETHKPRPVFHIAGQLQPTAEPERRTFQLPAPPPEREVVARSLGRVDLSAPPAPKERIERKVERGSPEFREMMREKMLASWARRRAEGKVPPKKAPKVRVRKPRVETPKVAKSAPPVIVLLEQVLAELRRLSERVAALEPRPLSPELSPEEIKRMVARPGPKPALGFRPKPKTLRRLLTRDPRWKDWCAAAGISSHTMSFPAIRALAKEWGLTDDDGRWTEHGATLDAAAAAAADARSQPVTAEAPEPDPEPDPDPAAAPAPAAAAGEPEPAPARPAPAKWGSDEWRAKLAANAVKAREAKARNEAERARKAKAEKKKAGRVNGEPAPLMPTRVPTKPAAGSLRRHKEAEEAEAPALSRAEERKLRRLARR